MITKEELDALVAQLGPQMAAKVKAELDAYEAKVKQFAIDAVNNGNYITKGSFEEYSNAAKTAVEAVKAICEKQGTTLAEVALKLSSDQVGTKSPGQVLRDDVEELRKIYSQGQGTKTYMLNLNAKGDWVMKPIDMTKTTGLEASVPNLPAGAVASITQALDAATLLRVGAGSMINSQYRNSAWIFDLCNTINASYISAQPFAMWFDEQPKVGASQTTAEGVAKTASQYIYQLQSATYKKEATIIGITEEFHIDFAQLESDLLNKGRIDVINRVNQAILPNIQAAATAYNTGASFQQGTVVPNVSDFDALAAMAAQVDNATFGAKANAAVMSTFKKYRMGIQKNLQGSYLNPPDVIANLAFVGNPSVGADLVMVGDFKQYNIILRGGLIVRVGYNGNDFGNNQFSTVMEQFYYDYISTVRKVAIVSGPDFATVKTAISA
jgi:hypothetical protein